MFDDNFSPDGSLIIASIITIIIITFTIVIIIITIIIIISALTAWLVF